MKAHEDPRVVKVVRETIAALNDDDRAEVEERAAIIEFDGNLPRALAERIALNAWIRQP